MKSYCEVDEVIFITFLCWIVTFPAYVRPRLEVQCAIIAILHSFMHFSGFERCISSQAKVQSCDDRTTLSAILIKCIPKNRSQESVRFKNEDVQSLCIAKTIVESTAEISAKSQRLLGTILVIISVRSDHSAV